MQQYMTHTAQCSEDTRGDVAKTEFTQHRRSQIRVFLQGKVQDAEEVIPNRQQGRRKRQRVQAADEAVQPPQDIVGSPVSLDHPEPDPTLFSSTHRPVVESWTDASMHMFPTPPSSAVGVDMAANLHPFTDFHGALPQSIHGPAYDTAYDRMQASIFYMNPISLSQFDVHSCFIPTPIPGYEGSSVCDQAAGQTQGTSNW